MQNNIGTQIPQPTGAESGEVLLRAVGLSRRFGAFQAVSKLELALCRGQVLGLLGPNGAGKSTTMQMLAGTLAPSAGKIEIAGVDLHREPRRAKSRIGYLPELPPVYPEMTVREYLVFCARLHRIGRHDLAEAVQRSLEQCGLTEVGHRLIGHLSKGFQQRVGLAQAILHDPDVIVLDEPTVGLDPIQIVEIRDLIRDLGRRHAVVLSTHILPEVQAVCDRVQIIRQGREVFSGPVHDLGRRESLRDRRVRVGLSRLSRVDALSELEGVQSVERLDDQHYRIYFQADAGKLDALSERIAQAALEKDWGLFELVPDMRTLEQIFMDLILGEEQPS